MHARHAAGDLNAVLAHFDTNTVLEHNAPPLTSAHPAYGVYTGPEGLKQFLQNINKVFEVTSFVSEPLYGDDTNSLALVHWSAKCRNNGAVVDVDYYDHWTFNGDKLVKASLLLPEARKVETACVSEEAAWVREGLAAGLAGDMSKLTVHPNATFVVRAPPNWPISGNYDYTQFIQQVVQVVDTPEISFRVVGSGNGQVLVEFDYPKFSTRKTAAHPKMTARNVKAYAIYDLVKVETVVEVPQSTPAVPAGEGILAGNVAPTPAHTVTQVAFQVSHLKYVIAASEPSVKVKKEKKVEAAPAAPAEETAAAEEEEPVQAEAEPATDAKAEKKAKKPKAEKAGKAEKKAKKGKKPKK